MNEELFLYLFDLAGTLVFAVSGAIAGVRKQLDLYGILILAVLTSLGGGLIRDVLLGRTPPLVLTDIFYLASAALGVVVVILLQKRLDRLVYPLRIADAIGLGIFTLIGTRVGLEYGCSWFAAVMMGMVSGTGGGMLRDVLVGEVPLVLQKEIYAVASMAGALSYVIWMQLATKLGFQGAARLPGLAMFLGAAFTALFRIVAVYRNWHLPKIRMDKPVE